MAQIDDGGPAFPHVAELVSGNDKDGFITRAITSNGMSLRDYFAGQAMAAILANPQHHEYLHEHAQRSEIAYEAADAMLKARSRP